MNDRVQEIQSRLSEIQAEVRQLMDRQHLLHSIADCATDSDSFAGGGAGNLAGMNTCESRSNNQRRFENSEGGSLTSIEETLEGLVTNMDWLRKIADDAAHLEAHLTGNARHELPPYGGSSGPVLPTLVAIAYDTEQIVRFLDDRMTSIRDKICINSDAAPQSIERQMAQSPGRRR